MEGWVDFGVGYWSIPIWFACPFTHSSSNHLIMTWPGIEPTTSRSQVRHPTVTPPSHQGSKPTWTNVVAFGHYSPAENEEWNGVSWYFNDAAKEVVDISVASQFAGAQRQSVVNQSYHHPAYKTIMKNTVNMHPQPRKYHRSVWNLNQSNIH